MIAKCVVNETLAAKLVMRLPIGSLSSFIPSGNSGSDIGRDDSTVIAEDLDSIVFRRVVAGRDLDRSRRLVNANQNADRGRGGDIRLEHIPSHPLECRSGDHGEHGARGATIPGQHNRSGRKLRRHGANVTDDHIGIERVSHNPTQSRDTDNQSAHRNTITGPCGFFGRENFPAKVSAAAAGLRFRPWCSRAPFREPSREDRRTGVRADGGDGRVQV